MLAMAAIKPDPMNVVCHVGHAFGECRNDSFPSQYDTMENPTTPAIRYKMNTRKVMGKPITVTAPNIPIANAATVINTPINPTRRTEDSIG